MAQHIFNILTYNFLFQTAATMNNIEYLCSYSTTVDTEMHSEQYCL